MSAIVPLSGGAKLPAYLANRAVLASINADVVSGGISYGILSIKGKVFALVKGDERKVLTRPDDPDEVLQSLTLTVLRANTKSRVFYMKAYSEDDDAPESKRPDCYSADGVAPAADARNPQAKKCQLCPHAVWGTKLAADGNATKGTACTVNTRLSVVDTDQFEAGAELEPYLLRLPAGSRANFSAVVKQADQRGIPYNALVLKTAFDKEAPAPKLTFKIVGLLDDAAYEVANKHLEADVVKEMLGLNPVRAALPAPAPAEEEATEDDLDAAIAARAAKQAVDKAKQSEKADLADMDDLAPKAEEPKAKAAPKPRAKPAPKIEEPEEEAPAPKAEAKPAAESAGGMLEDIDNLLGSFDD